MVLAAFKRTETVVVEQATTTVVPATYFDLLLESMDEPEDALRLARAARTAQRRRRIKGGIAQGHRPTETARATVGGAGIHGKARPSKRQIENALRRRTRPNGARTSNARTPTREKATRSALVAFIGSYPLETTGIRPSPALDGAVRAARTTPRHAPPHQGQSVHRRTSGPHAPGGRTRD
jgi:hypothetical protein